MCKQGALLGARGHFQPVEAVIAAQIGKEGAVVFVEVQEGAALAAKEPAAPFVERQCAQRGEKLLDPVEILRPRVPHAMPARFANASAPAARSGTRAPICIACGLAAVPSRTRPAMPWQIAASRKAL